MHRQGIVAASAARTRRVATADLKLFTGQLATQQAAMPLETRLQAVSEQSENCM